MVGTLLGHAAFAGSSLSVTPRPFAVAAYEHARGELLLGLTGLPGLLGLAVLLLLAALLWTAFGRTIERRDALIFGLLAGGVLCNATEVVVRGSVLDWFWIAAGQQAIVINAADAALVGGGLLLLWSALQRVTDAYRQMQHKGSATHGGA
jgi:lipoprotein signal peptidase